MKNKICFVMVYIMLSFCFIDSISADCEGAMENGDICVKIAGQQKNYESYPATNTETGLLNATKTYAYRVTFVDKDGKIQGKTVDYYLKYICSENETCVQIYDAQQWVQNYYSNSKFELSNSSSLQERYNALKKSKPSIEILHWTEADGKEDNISDKMLGKLWEKKLKPVSGAISSTMKTLRSNAGLSDINFNNLMIQNDLFITIERLYWIKITKYNTDLKTMEPREEYECYSHCRGEEVTASGCMGCMSANITYSLKEKIDENYIGTGPQIAIVLEYANSNCVGSEQIVNQGKGTKYVCPSWIRNKTGLNLLGMSLSLNANDVKTINDTWSFNIKLNEAKAESIFANYINQFQLPNYGYDLKMVKVESIENDDMKCGETNYEYLEKLHDADFEISEDGDCCYVNDEDKGKADVNIKCEKPIVETPDPPSNLKYTCTYNSDTNQCTNDGYDTVFQTLASCDCTKINSKTGKQENVSPSSKLNCTYGNSAYETEYGSGIYCYETTSYFADDFMSQISNKIIKSGGYISLKEMPTAKITKWCYSANDMSLKNYLSDSEKYKFSTMTLTFDGKEYIFKPRHISETTPVLRESIDLFGEKVYYARNTVTTEYYYNDLILNKYISKLEGIYYSDKLKYEKYEKTDTILTADVNLVVPVSRSENNYDTSIKIDDVSSEVRKVLYYSPATRMESDCKGDCTIAYNNGKVNLKYAYEQINTKLTKIKKAYDVDSKEKENVTKAECSGFCKSSSYDWNQTTSGASASCSKDLNKCYYKKNEVNGHCTKNGRTIPVPIKNGCIGVGGTWTQEMSSSICKNADGTWNNNETTCESENVGGTWKEATSPTGTCKCPDSITHSFELSTPSDNPIKESICTNYYDPIKLVEGTKLTFMPACSSITYKKGTSLAIDGLTCSSTYYVYNELVTCEDSKDKNTCESNKGTWESDKCICDSSPICDSSKEVCEVIGSPNLVFRPISLKNPFPGYNGNGRMTGKNWCNDDDCSNENDKVKTYITNKNTSVYNLKPLYSITLTPKLISEIRTYNKSNTYDDFDMKCLDNGTMCLSKFLTNKKYIFNEKKSSCYGITTAHEWYNCLDSKNRGEIK